MKHSPDPKCSICLCVNCISDDCDSPACHKCQAPVEECSRFEQGEIRADKLPPQSPIEEWLNKYGINLDWEAKTELLKALAMEKEGGRHDP